MQDKFLPQKGFNEIFTELINCDIIARPSGTGTLHPLFFFSKRPGLTTQIGTGGTYDRQLDSDIAGGHYYNSVIYPYSDAGTLYSFDADLLTSLKTGLNYDSTYSDKTIQLSYLGGGRYPDSNSVYTVASYNSTTAVITISETLSAADQAALVGKYVYVKTGPAQRGQRSIASAAANTITLTSAFGVDPVATNILWIYDEIISQARYPQLRQGTDLTYIFYVNSAITVEPTVGATYTNNSVTFTLVSADLTSGKGNLTFTCTAGSPDTSGTLTKTAGTGDATITFYDTDKGSERFYARDTDGNEMYWYYPNDKKLVSRDNRVIGLHKNGQTILPRDSQDSEQILTTKIVTLGSASALNIDVYGGYLMVFFNDRMGLLKKTIIDTATQDFVYTYQDLLEIGLYSEKSYTIYGGNLYVFGNDRRLYSITLTSSTGNEIIAVPKDQGEIMIEYFKDIEGGSVSFTYGRGVLRMIHTKDDGTTSIYKYFESFTGWILDQYSDAGNLFKFMYNIANLEYVPNGDKMYSISGLQDGTDNIEQIIRMEGPLQEYLDIFTLQKIKWRMGFNGDDGMGCVVKISIGGSKKTVIEKDINSLSAIDSINQYIEGAGTIGGGIIGEYLIGGEAGIGSLTEYYSDYIDIATNIAKKGSYFQIEFKNNTNTQMLFGGAKATYFLYNPNVTYNKLVI